MNGREAHSGAPTSAEPSNGSSDGGFGRLAKVFAGFGTASVFGTLTQLARAKLGALLLGTAGVGVLNQLTAFASMAQVLSSLGVNVGIVRSVARGIEKERPQDLATQISSAGLLLLATSLLTCGLVALNAARMSHWLFADGGSRADLVVLVSLSLPFLTLANVYKSMLSGARSVRGLVRAQVGSDLLSVAVFAALVVPLGLTGATLAYVVAQLMLLAFRARAAFTALGSNGVVPRIRHFRSNAVTENLAYGVNGLVTAGTATLVTILVSRHVIATMGEADNGIFTTAIKVGTLFLAGVYGTANSYVLPSLVAARTDEDKSKFLSQTLKLYMFTLPPIMAGLMAFGEPLVRLLFAKSFTFAGVLLVPILVADFLRTLTETLGLALIAERKLAVVTGAYLAYALLLGALVFNEAFGLGLLAIGFAFIAAQAVHLGIMFSTARLLLGVGPSKSTIATFCLTCGYLCATVAISLSIDAPASRYVAMLAVSAVWLGTCLLDGDFRQLIKEGWCRVGRILVRSQTSE